MRESIAITRGRAHKRLCFAARAAVVCQLQPTPLKIAACILSRLQSFRGKRARARDKAMGARRENKKPRRRRKKEERERARRVKKGRKNQDK